ncbi:MAG TPA: hypothetical protein VN963_11095 [bacterium]|jgi:hypothetical protein|nr:hypothetical protein [bacterium]
MKNEMTKLLRMAGIFKMNLSRWPKNAAELVGFVNRQGWTVDVSSYYTLTFNPVSGTALAVEMAWPAPGNWLTRLRVEIELKNALPENGFDWVLRTKTLSPEKRKTRSYCFIEPAKVSRRKSA